MRIKYKIVWVWRNQENNLSEQDADITIEASNKKETQASLNKLKYKPTFNLIETQFEAHLFNFKVLYKSERKEPTIFLLTRAKLRRGLEIGTGGVWSG